MSNQDPNSSDREPPEEITPDQLCCLTGAERDALVELVRETTAFPRFVTAVRERGYDERVEITARRGRRPDDPFDIYQVSYVFRSDDGGRADVLWHGLHPERLDEGVVSYDMVREVWPDEALLDGEIPLPFVIAILEDVGLSMTDDGIKENQLDKEGLLEAAEEADFDLSC